MTNMLRYPGIIGMGSIIHAICGCQSLSSSVAVFRFMDTHSVETTLPFSFLQPFSVGVNSPIDSRGQLFQGKNFHTVM